MDVYPDYLFTIKANIHTISNIAAAITKPPQSGKNTINQPSHQASVDFKKRGNESPQKAHFSVSFIIRNTTNNNPPIPIPLDETWFFSLILFLLKLANRHLP